MRDIRLSDRPVEIAWEAGYLEQNREWTTTLADVDRELLWSDAIHHRWISADTVRAPLRRFLLSRLRTFGFVHVSNLARVDTAGEQGPPGFTFLLRQLGRIVEQNGAGSMAQVLRDRDGDGAIALDYHCATSDLLVLLCLQPAADGGGRTRIASGRAVVDQLRAERPDVLTTLLEQDFCFDRRGRAGTQIVIRPIFRILDDGAVDLYYQSRTVRNTPHTYGPALTAAQIEALDVLDEILRRPSTGYGLMLEAGDLLVIRNSRVLHGRSPYVDHPDCQARRMLRIWMDTDEL